MNSGASLMLKIMGMMASLPRDTMSKACRRAFISIEAVVKDGGNCLKKIENIYPNVQYISRKFCICIFKNLMLLFCLETLTLGLIFSVHPVEEELVDLFSTALLLIRNSCSSFHLVVLSEVLLLVGYYHIFSFHEGEHGDKIQEALLVRCSWSPHA
jgi:hypothetical protein